MQEIQRCCIRFHLYTPAHYKAWTYLQDMDRKKYKSYADFVAEAINAYVEAKYADEEDEAVKRENRLVERICGAVQKCISDTLSSEILKRIFNSGEKSEKPTRSETSKSDIDWDFIGGRDIDVKI